MVHTKKEGNTGSNITSQPLDPNAPYKALQYLTPYLPKGAPVREGYRRAIAALEKRFRGELKDSKGAPAPIMRSSQRCSWHVSMDTAKETKSREQRLAANAKWGGHVSVISTILNMTAHHKARLAIADETDKLIKACPTDDIGALNVWLANEEMKIPKEVRQKADKYREFETTPMSGPWLQRSAQMAEMAKTLDPEVARAVALKRFIEGVGCQKGKDVSTVIRELEFWNQSEIFKNQKELQYLRARACMTMEERCR